MSRSHGHTKNNSASPTYRSWMKMIQRCTNPNNDKFDYYGGRGITVCDRWRLFDNFLEDMGERPPSLTLDRKENDVGYHKENCRWATKSEQMTNRRPYTHPNHRGANSPKAVLTMEQARQIRALKGTSSHREIAARFGVAHATVGDILRNQTYQETT